MRRRTAAAIRTIAAAVWIAGLSLAATAVTGSQVEGPPARIISLVPAVTEMLFALGAGGRVVAVSSFDRFPPEIERLPRVGALLDPDVERILSLDPDLVVAYRSQADLRTQLGRAKVPVFTYVHAGLADVTVTLAEIGERIGAGARAAALAKAIERDIASHREAARGKPRPRTLVVFGRDPFELRGIYASGGIGFVHDMVTAAGGENVFGDVRKEAVQATAELIIARRPEVIVELRPEPMAADALARERRTWLALGSVPAVRSGRVHIIGDPRTVVPGPRVAEGVALLAGVLREAK